MADRIDHAAKAEQIIAETPEQLSSAALSAWFAEAQVHATLALAEQQRVANLIALAGIAGIRQEHRENAVREARVALGLGEAVSHGH